MFQGDTGNMLGVQLRALAMQLLDTGVCALDVIWYFSNLICVLHLWLQCMSRLFAGCYLQSAATASLQVSTISIKHVAYTPATNPAAARASSDVDNRFTRHF